MAVEIFIVFETCFEMCNSRASERKVGNTERKGERERVEGTESEREIGTNSRRASVGRERYFQALDFDGDSFVLFTLTLLKFHR